jgi:uridylate kinase
MPALHPSPHYKRILVKISGGLLKSPSDSIDTDRLCAIAKELKAVAGAGVQVAVLLGGGNIYRGAEVADKKVFSRVTADHMGMLGTVINGLAMTDMLESVGANVRLMSAVSMDRVAEPYILSNTLRHMKKGCIIVLVAGGNPYLTTDTVAALRALEIGAQIIFKATNVDGIYTADPSKDKNAQRFDAISFDDCLAKNLQVMDATAFTLCRENKLPVLVFNLLEENALPRAAAGEKIGTLVS